MNDPTFAVIVGQRPEGKALSEEQTALLRGAVFEQAMGGVRLDVLSWLEAEHETREAWIIALDRIETSKARTIAAETAKALGALMLGATR